MPCGLVYGVLAWTLAAGGAQAGAELMAAFGAGTLPALFAVGAAACWLGEMPAVDGTPHGGHRGDAAWVYASWAPGTSLTAAAGSAMVAQTYGYCLPVRV